LRAWLFGSYSRGEETSDSDIDILVQYKDAENISLFTISRIMCSLSKLLNRLVEEDGLLSFATDSVFHDRILIYEREN
ncbi:nucleotidyltransferase family protein, partial [uncultured Parabacteroides sp.]